MFDDIFLRVVPISYATRRAGSFIFTLFLYGDDHGFYGRLRRSAWHERQRPADAVYDNIDFAVHGGGCIYYLELYGFFGGRQADKVLPA